MPSPECKVYFDGSHYIAIPHTTRPYRPRRKRNEEKITVKPPGTAEDGGAKDDTMSEGMTQNDATMSEDKPSESPFPADALTPIERMAKEGAPISDAPSPPAENHILNENGDVRIMTKRELFNEVYKENVYKKYKERKAALMKAMRPYFKTDDAAENYVESNLQRKKRNLICRRVRMTRKANLANFNYFCTFTYDDKKHTEETFKKKLKNKLSLLAYRQGWKYMGVWERSPEKQRLHFHGLFYIPDGKMIGKVERHDDYSVRLKRVQTTYQNTYFNERFGRSDFETVDDKSKLGEAMAYLMKYIEKSGEKIVYSKGLPQFFISDIMDEDVVCPCGLEDKKLLLYDDFVCWDEGTMMGTVSEDTIRLMRKSN